MSLKVTDIERYRSRKSDSHSFAKGGKADEYAEMLRLYLWQCDDWAIIELLAELNTIDKRCFVWRRLNSVERGTIKKILSEYES